MRSFLLISWQGKRKGSVPSQNADQWRFGNLGFDVEVTAAQVSAILEFSSLAVLSGGLGLLILTSSEIS